MPHADIEAHRAYQREYQKKWREKNRDKTVEYSRRWKLRNPHYYQDREYRKKLAAGLPTWEMEHPDPEKTRFLRKPADPAETAAKKREWTQANRDRAADRELRRQYGIGIAEYASMLAAQAGRCAICATDTPGGGRKRFAVDHCHATGSVRQLLCSMCNGGLGLFRDDPMLMRKAISYLERHMPEEAMERTG